ncbi:autotransporter domain-containing protein [Desulfovibrio piger]|uniref:autotransporter domain-containing protein n=1 Tax=Desulfovibrio piger TaxID=901 RepID=UPI0026F09CF2|nr:autotransporter domain-containing protein [Desulfovibrio piger]
MNNANVTVHSGILFGVAGGGIAESYNTGTADATVTNANLTINGGTINGVEYKGVDTDKVKVAVLGGGIAKGTKATANATTTNTVINGGKINGHVVAGGLADGGTATVGTANVTNANLTINGGEINGSVYAGGAALNSGTATVENFDVRITGGNITGDVVAGDYTGETPETKAVVLKTSPSKGTAGKGGTITIGGDATIGGKVDASAGGVATNVVIDGADATVTGGYEGNKDSTLTFNNYDDKFDNVAYGFGTLNVAEGSNVRMDAVVSGKQGTAPEDPQTGFFGARHDAEGSSNPITITGGGTITAKQFHVSTNADVTIAHGNVVADDVQVQSATLKVGGESTSASLTVNEELIIDKTHPGNQNIDVENLGTLTLGKNIVLDENGELKAEYLDTVPSHVKAGGTLKINGLDGKTLTDKELASLQGLLNSNIPDIPPGEGLLDLGGADLGEVEPNADGTVSYANVAGITTDSLKDTTVTVTDEQNAAGISGGFQAVKLTGADTELNAKGTLVLAGSQNGDNLVIDTKGAVADLRVGGAYATRDTSAVTLGLADANNSGTVGTVTLNAGTDNKATLNVIGAGAAEFKVGDIRANESTNTINVAGATLKTGNITTESGTKALDKLNITSGIVNASGNVNITDVALANGVLTANKVPATAEGVPATGDITLGTLSGQGAVVADNALTVTNDYNGADTDALGLQADTLTTAAFNSTKGDVAIKASQWNASGTTTLKGDTVVLTEAGTFTGAFTMDGGTLVAQSGDDANLATLTFKDDATFTNGAVTVVDSIKMNGTTNKTLTVGTDDDKVGGTTLSAQHIDLNDGMLLVDPAWNKASSNVAVASMGTPTPSSTTDVVLDGSVGVGQNSYLALGTADTGWLPGVVGNYTKGVGLSQDGITAALGVFKGIEIAAGKNLTVDGSKTGTEINTGWTSSGATNSATFADNSLLVINGQNIYGDKAAISFKNPGTLSVAEGAKLLVTDAVAGQTYTIVGNVTNPATNLAGWKNNGMTSTTDMISLGDAKFDGTDKVTTSAVRNDAHTVFPNLSDGMANAVNDLYTGHAGAAGQPNWDYADVNSDQMGVRFLSRATDNRFLGMDKNAAAESIESAARIAFAGAAPQMTRMASDAGTNAVVNRLGFADPADGAQAMDAEGKIVDRNTTGFALWIAPLWQSQHGWGLDAGNMDYGFNGNLGGVSLGADYTFENAIRAGITFNIGGGYAESSGGDLSSTENRMNFWGLGAYAGWNYENFGVMADVSYTSTWNQLKQDLDSRLGMGNKLEADVQASAISAGLRAEYLLQTSAMDIIPHIGVRYMSLNTWGYDVDTHGGTVLEGDSLHQDIWTFPIGVTFTKDFALDSGWSFKPSLDFTVIPAAGDIKAKHDVHFTGLPGTYEVETQMMDYLTWQGGVGLELANDNMSIGVNYTLQAGQHTTGHGVFGSFRYEF